MTQSLLIWIGISTCLAGSALCSGLTLGFFSLGRIRLELLDQQGDALFHIAKVHNTTTAQKVMAEVQEEINLETPSH